ncbi:helix-turn-helix transcriptional regulator, partial [Blautia sp. MSK22_86]
GKMFRKDIGTSLNDYINSLRVEKAKHLLENTNTKVIDIALEVGFDTLPYFSSVFKKYTGVSPAEFRKKE